MVIRSALKAVLVWRIVKDVKKEKSVVLTVSVENFQKKGMSEMAYTPELSKQASAILRRIAWSMNIPMTKTQEIIYQKIIVKYFDRQTICKACRDKACALCVFSD